MADIIGITVKRGTWIGSISLDASLSEGHSMTAEATDHPVEQGSSISDHVHIKPRVVTIEGIISNHPIKLPASQVDGVNEVDVEFEWKAVPNLPVQLGGPGLLGAATGALVSAVGGDVQKGSAKGFEPPFDRVQSVREELDRIWKEGEPIDIVTTLAVYHDMVIESLEITRSAGSSSIMNFTATCKQISLVSTGLVVAPPEPKVERGKEEKDRGKQAAGPASEVNADKGKSLLAAGVDSLLG